MGDVVSPLGLVGLAWAVLVSALCFAATQRFVSGLLWSLAVAGGLPFWYLARDGVTSEDVAYAAALLVFAAAPCTLVGVLFGFYRQGQRSRDRMHCRRCGYDLTGNVSEVCPECGVTT